MSFARVQTESREFNQLQLNLATTLQPILTNPLFNNQILRGVVLASGANTIYHLLDREPQGFIITDINAAAHVYRTAKTDKTITLQASAAVTVDIYLF